MATSKNSRFRKISNWLHLWLGLFSGIVVFVVCLTAAIWTFREEMTYYFTPGQRVENLNLEFLNPSTLVDRSKDYVSNVLKDSLITIYNIEYRGRNQSASISYSDRQDQYQVLYLNPYSGEVLYRWHKGDAMSQFSDFLRAGHRFFWLPREIGSPFVGTCCIIFLITLITGLIWWYPTKWTKSTRDKSFKIKWNANWKRVNIDLHNVLGFYTLIFTIILTITGIVFTFQWFDKSYHWLLTGGKPKAEYPQKGSSDTTLVTSNYIHPENELFNQFKSHPKIRITYPAKPSDVYVVYIDPRGHNEMTTWHSFDQKTLKLVGGTSFQQALTWGQTIHRANYEIHVGTIGGFPTKILASLASLIGASLPVTGCIIWYNRKWGKKKKVVRKKVELA